VPACGRENLWYNRDMNPVIPNLHPPTELIHDYVPAFYSYDSPHPALNPEFVATFIDLTDTQRSSQAAIAICNIERMSDWRYTEKQWRPGETYFHRGEIDAAQPFFTFKSSCGYKKLECEFNNLLAFECDLKHTLIEKILKILDPIPW